MQSQPAPGLDGWFQATLQSESCHSAIGLPAAALRTPSQSPDVIALIARAPDLHCPLRALARWAPDPEQEAWLSICPSSGLSTVGTGGELITELLALLMLEAGWALNLSLRGWNSTAKFFSLLSLGQGVKSLPPLARATSTEGSFCLQSCSAISLPG